MSLTFKEFERARKIVEADNRRADAAAALERKTRWVFRGDYLPGIEGSHLWAVCRSSVAGGVVCRDIRKALFRSWIGRTRPGRWYLRYVFHR